MKNTLLSKTLQFIKRPQSLDNLVWTENLIGILSNYQKKIFFPHFTIGARKFCVKSLASMRLESIQKSSDTNRKQGFYNITSI